MITPGLVSVTFRSWSPAQIVGAAARRGLKAIEWGGDVHVPGGDLRRAREVAQITRSAGLVTAAYGSYYRAGEGQQNDQALDAAVETALALEAPCMRVWAGSVASARASDEHRGAVLDDLARVAERAAVKGVRVATEFHDRTLCDTAEATIEVLATVGHENLRTLWQPQHGMKPEHNVSALRRLLPWLAHVHVFHWWPGPEHRLPLADGFARWRVYFDALRDAGISCPALLEFVQDDDVTSLDRDAQTLHELLT